MAEIGFEILPQRDFRVEDAGPVFLDGGPERAQGVGALAGHDDEHGVVFAGVLALGGGEHGLLQVDGRGQGGDDHEVRGLDGLVHDGPVRRGVDDDQFAVTVRAPVAR